MVGAWIIIGIQLCVSAGLRVNVDAQSNIPFVYGLFLLDSASLWKVFLFHVLVVDGVMACVDDA